MVETTQFGCVAAPDTNLRRVGTNAADPSAEAIGAGLTRSESQGAGRRLLIVSFEAFAIAGLQRVVLDIARCLAERKWAVRVLFPEASGEALLSKWRAEVEPVEIVITPAVKRSYVYRSPLDVLALRREITAFKPDVVNFHYGVHHCSSKDVAAAALAWRRPIVTIHAPIEKSEGQLIPRGSNQERAMRVSGPFVRRFVANSRNSARGIQLAGIASSKISTVPCGVREVPRVDRNAARDALGVSGEDFVI